MNAHLRLSGLFAGLLLAATACTEAVQPTDQTEKPDQPAAQRLVSSNFYFVDRSNYSVRYLYTEEGLLREENELNEKGDLRFVMDYAYTGRRLTRQQVGRQPTEAEFRYFYEGNRLVRSEYTEFRNEPQAQHWERTYEYPETDVVRITERNLKTSQVSSTVLYYKDNNVVRTAYFASGKEPLTEETVFGYDTKKNPYYGLTGETSYTRFTTRNNVTSLKTLVKNGVPEVTEVRFAYDYNAAGLPEKKYQLAPDGRRILEQSYEYTSN